MGTVNQSAANLQAAEQATEAAVTKLGTAMTTAFTDLQAEIANDLSAAGVPDAQVDAVTAKMTAFQTNVIAPLTASATTADPGAQPTPPAPTGGTSTT